MILVTGGSASGKSAYAESLLTETEEAAARYYIATMRVWDGEDRARVAKHRRMREGKGFCTIEQPTDLIRVLDRISLPACAILECMSNLVANEMFREGGSEPADLTAGRILRQVNALDEALDLLIVVTDNVFEDGNLYEPSTMEYLRALGEINRQMAGRARRVIEVLAGIPIVLKPAESFAGGENNR